MHMPRSRKRVPVASFPSGKWNKRQAHSALRLHSRLEILHCRDWDELMLPVIREVSDIWSMSKEDRHWITPRWSDYLGQHYPNEKALARLKRK
jgi:hypothetical protein